MVNIAWDNCDVTLRSPGKGIDLALNIGRFVLGLLSGFAAIGPIWSRKPGGTEGLMMASSARATGVTASVGLADSVIISATTATPAIPAGGPSSEGLPSGGQLS